MGGARRLRGGVPFILLLGRAKRGVSEYAHWGDRLGRGARELPGVTETFQIGVAGGALHRCMELSKLPKLYIYKGHFIICKLHPIKKIHQLNTC